jgi:NADH-quinone oxidoreductase subunit I
MHYFRNMYQAVRTVAEGLWVTLPYHFARTVVVQYPDVEPTLQGRYRGFHVYQIERCIACEACARACPAGCIHVSKNGNRRMDRVREIAVGGAISEYRIDYRTCLFCGLCTEVCPNECLQMGSIHDHSCHRREDLVADFIELAKQGRRTIEPIWLTKTTLPGWAARARDYWRRVDQHSRQRMARADDPQYCGELARESASPEEEAA